MMLLPGLGLSAPWALGLLILLPLLWLLLRLSPPPPRRQRFPALRLLEGLETLARTPEYLPPWLLILRLVMVALLILAAAGPVVGGDTRGGGAVLLVVDDGWASARDWPSRRARLLAETEAVLRQGGSIRLLPTAPGPEGGPILLSPPLAGEVALDAVRALEPRPWPTERKAAAAALASLPSERIVRVLWLADGIEDGGGRDLARALQALGGGLDMVIGRAGRQMSLTDGVPGEGLVVRIRRLPTPQPEPVAVRALDQGGLVLARAEAVLVPTATEALLRLEVPPPLLARIARLEVEGEGSAAAMLLADPLWRTPELGLVQGDGQGAALLDPHHYLRRALDSFTRVRTAPLAELLAVGGPGVLLLADGPPPASDDAARLRNRIEEGAVLLRFAGPWLARGVVTGKGDPLLPVGLRAGGRALGGAMSWTEPVGLAPFVPTGPFGGLEVPSEVTVRAQVLADPEDLASMRSGAQVWARLADGTPLVTAARRGKGWVVLVHTTADPQWTDLPLSGLFPAMLRRLVLIQAGGGGAVASAGPLPPVRVLDGMGRLGVPGTVVRALPAGGAPPGPHHPPGLYGEGAAAVVANLAPGLEPPRPLAVPPGARRLGGDEGEPGLSLRPALLMAALALLLAEGVVALGVMGLLGRLLPAVLWLGMLSPVWAAERGDVGRAVRLGCLKVGDRVVEADCMAGLDGLSRLLARRSTVQPGPPVLVEAGRDPLDLLPLLYWSVRAGQAPLSPHGVHALSGFMARGGLLVIDTGAGDMGHDAQARALAPLAGLTVPPLVPMPENHVLNRSFYLTREAPGRWASAPVWVAADDAAGARDGVSPVVLGGADWVGAWAVDQRERPLHGVVPGGEAQRELAFRFGVNLVLHALTGNYKADQVHLPAILERLGR